MVDPAYWINIATPVSTVLIGWLTWNLTRRKHIEDRVHALHASANEDRSWLRAEVNQLRKDNKELSLELLAAQGRIRTLESLLVSKGIKFE